MSDIVVEKTGDIFSTGANVIAHGVNTVGVMGAGIAVAFRDSFPEMYNAYREQCRQGFNPGGAYIWVQAENLWIANISSQEKPGRYARYAWLTLGAYQTYLEMIKAGKEDWTIAFPQIGCGIGGLDWNIVKGILTDLGEGFGIKTELWTYGN